MIGTHKVYCLCGSIRFKREFEEQARWLTLSGNIVLMPNVWCHDSAFIERSITKDMKDRLDELHLRKIDMADVVFIINPENYIGESTKNEIKYALQKGKEIMFEYDYAIKTKDGKSRIDIILSEIQ